MARPKKFDEAAVLLTALDVFWKKGCGGTSMADLPKSMEINAPSLFDTFGDNRQLFLTALQTYMCYQHDWMRQSVAENKPVKDIMKLLLTSLLDEILSDPDRRGCFMVNTITEMANQDSRFLALPSTMKV